MTSDLKKKTNQRLYNFQLLKVCFFFSLRFSYSFIALNLIWFQCSLLQTVTFNYITRVISIFFSAISIHSTLSLRDNTLAHLNFSRFHLLYISRNNLFFHFIFILFSLFFCLFVFSRLSTSIISSNSTWEKIMIHIAGFESHGSRNHLIGHIFGQTSPTPSDTFSDLVPRIYHTGYYCCHILFETRCCF